MKTFSRAFALCLCVVFGFAFIGHAIASLLHHAPLMHGLGLSVAASACFTAGLGFALIPLDADSDSPLVSVRYESHFYKRGFWFRRSEGKTASWAYVGKRLILNRGYFFNV